MHLDAEAYLVLGRKSCTRFENQRSRKNRGDFFFALSSTVSISAGTCLPPTRARQFLHIRYHRMDSRGFYRPLANLQ